MGRTDWSFLYAGFFGATMAAVTVACAPLALAAGVEEFYKGRNLQVVIGYSPGGGYDLYARVLAHHIGHHLPGIPSVTPQNMPGAGSLKAASYLYSVAPRDGTVIGIFGRGLAMEPLIGTSDAKFDARKFTWLGSIGDQVSVCATWHGSKVGTWNEALSTPFTVAGEGSGSDPDIFAMLLRNMFGLKLKLITGYPGGNEMSLAMEQGEVDGRCGWSWSSIKLAKPAWIANKQINVIVQMSLARSPELPNTPFIMDYAADDRQMQILKLVLSRQTMAWPFVAPPNVPADRKDALRAAFDETMRDPAFIAEARKAELEVNPTRGSDLERITNELYATPQAAILAARAAIALNPP
jgi:tripartite-type tricarboxylate transporter receptor subunit TctC